MKIGHEHVGVRVPATSANLGPGFDSVGLALALYDDVEAWATTAPTSVEVTGVGAESLPRGEDHLVVRAIRAALDFAGAPQTGLRLRCHNRIPHGKGLGSSAAAVVAGILVARGMIADQGELGLHAALYVASEIEGHPDNAAPALLGGATVAWIEPDSPPEAVKVEVHPDLVVSVLIPDGQLSTATARGLLPRTVPLADAAFNVSRAALLPLALGSSPDLLLAATADRLHQEYRADAFSDSFHLVRQLRQRGIAAVISGAGPAVLVLGTRQLPADLVAGWNVIYPAIDRQGGQLWRL